MAEEILTSDDPASPRFKPTPMKKAAGSMGTKKEGVIVEPKEQAVLNRLKPQTESEEDAAATVADALDSKAGARDVGSDPRQGARAIDQYEQEVQDVDTIIEEDDAEAAEATADLVNVDEVMADTEDTGVDPGDEFRVPEEEFAFDTPIEGDVPFDPDSLTDEEFFERYGSTREDMEAADAAEAEADAEASAPEVLPPDEVEDLEPLEGRELRQARRQARRAERQQNRRMRMDGMGAGPAPQPVAGAGGSKDDPGVAEAIAPSLTDTDDAEPAAAPRTSPGPTRQGGGLFRNNMLGRIRQQRRKVNQMARAAQSEEELEQVKAELDKLNELKDLRQSKRDIRKAARGRRANVFRDLTEDAAAKALEKEAEAEETEEETEDKKSTAPPPPKEDPIGGTTGLVVDPETGAVTDTDAAITSFDQELNESPIEEESEVSVEKDYGVSKALEAKSFPDIRAAIREVDANSDLGLRAQESYIMGARAFEYDVQKPEGVSDYDYAVALRDAVREGHEGEDFKREVEAALSGGGTSPAPRASRYVARESATSSTDDYGIPSTITRSNANELAMILESVASNEDVMAEGFLLPGEPDDIAELAAQAKLRKPDGVGDVEFLNVLRDAYREDMVRVGPAATRANAFRQLVEQQLGVE